MIQQMALISEKSPIHDELGCELDTEATEAIDRIRNPEGSAKSVSQVCTEWQKRTKTDVSSLEVLKQWSSAQAIVNAREYGKHVVQYAEEWEEAVTERVEKEQKNVRKLLGDRSHYEKKVEAMRKRDNEMQTKGKTSTAGQLEKLQRNEEKLRESFTIHESEAGRLCVLIGTVTQEGWRDLYFLAKNYMKWESNRVGRESDIFSEIPKTLDSMKAKTAIGSKKKREEEGHK